MAWVARCAALQLRRPSLQLLTAVAVLPWLMLPVQCGCPSPAVATVSVDVVAGALTVTVGLTNASASPLPSVVVYYFNSAGGLAFSGPKNTSIGQRLTFVLQASSLPLVAGVAVRVGYESPEPLPPYSSSDSGGAHVSGNQQAVVFIRPADVSPDADSTGRANWLRKALGNASCTEQPLLLSRGLLTNADLNTLKLCRLGSVGDLQYTAVAAQGSCPEVVLSELGLGSGADGSSNRRFVEFYCEGCIYSDLSGYSVAFFDVDTNISLFAVSLRSTITNDRGFALLDITATGPAQLPSNVSTDRGLIAVYASVLSQNVSLNLSNPANRSGLVAAVAYSKNAAGLKQLRDQVASITAGIGKQSMAVSLGRSSSENMSLSYCSSPVLGTPARFLLSEPTPTDANSCRGVVAADSRRILHINEFNADVLGAETGPNQTEFIELAVNATANTTLDNYYVVIYQGLTLAAIEVFPLAAIVATPTQRFLVIGTGDVCRPCDISMLGNKIPNGMAAIAIHYREEGDIPRGWVATRDGLVDAYVYTTVINSEHPELVKLLGLDGSHVIYEDDSAFVLGDESVGLCGDMMSLMLMTPGLPNNCLDNPSALKQRSFGSVAVYVNEWQPGANGKSLYVELVGPPGTSLSQLALKVALLNRTSGAILRESGLLKLDQWAQLSPAGLYGLSSGMDALTVDVSGNSSDIAYRLMLAVVLNKTAWSHAEPLLPLDSVDVITSDGAASSQPGRFVLLDLAGGKLSASRCRLNANAPASAAANSPAFDPRPVTPNATANSCPVPFTVLINEVLPPTSSAGSPFIELLIPGPSNATVSLDGFVLVYWSGDNGTAIKSSGLGSVNVPKSTGQSEQIIILEGTIFTPPNGARYVVALYYNYDFLYPVGKPVATAERLLDSAAYSVDFSRRPLSDDLIKTFRSLYPSPDKSFYDQGVVTILSSSSQKPSLSRCPGRKGSTTDAFASMQPTKGNPNGNCTASGVDDAITVQHCLLPRIRINEVAVNSSGGFVELVSSEPGLPLTGLSIILLWSDGGRDSWSSGANYSVASWQPTKESSLSAMGYYAAQLVATDISPRASSSVVFGVALALTSSAMPAATQLNFSVEGVRAMLDSWLIDVLAVFVQGGSAAAAAATSSAWPPTSPHAPLSSPGGLLGTASFSRCYVGSNAAKVNAAFSAASSARATPGAANDCPPPPVFVQFLCSAGSPAGGGGGAASRSISLKLVAPAAPLLPLERLRVVTYGGQEQVVSSFVADDLQLKADFIGNDGSLTVTSPYVPKVNDTLLAVAVYFYPPGMSVAVRPATMPEPRQQSTPTLVHALMLHYQPYEGPWQRLAQILQIDSSNVSLVPMPNSSTSVCIGRCQAATGWLVRQVQNVELKSCPLQSGESVVINEIDVKQAGLDNREFIELKGPPGLDASYYLVKIILMSIGGTRNFDIHLEGTFSPKGFFVIGLAGDHAMPFPGNVQGLLTNSGGAVALYKTGDTQDTGLVDAVVYATSAETAQKTGEVILPSIPVKEKSEVLIDDPRLYGGNGTISRCFCDTARDLTCFTLSMQPTAGADNFCLLENQPLSLKFCLNRTAVDNPDDVKEGLALAIGENCSCVFSSYQLSNMKECDAGVQFYAYGTAANHLAAIGRSFAAVLSRGRLSIKAKGRDLAISSNCSLGCPATSPPLTTGSNAGVVAGIVVAVVVLIAAGIVTVYFIRKRQADRGFQMARFDGTFDDDDAFVGDNATGRVTFSNPFRGPSADRRQYAKL